MWSKLKLVLAFGKGAAVLVVAFLAAIVILTLIPPIKGYSALVVTSESMAPAIQQGSIILIKMTDRAAKGEIITYRPRGEARMLVTHRVVDVKNINGKQWYQVKGDAVPMPDMELVKPEQLVGKLEVIIPYLGKPVAFAKTQVGVVVLVVIPASIIVYEELKTIVREIKQLRQKINSLERKEQVLESELTQRQNKRKRK